MSAARIDLWERLKRARLVQGELPAGTGSPWFVRAMLGIAGWIGALFVLGFIGAGFAIAFRTVGAAALAGAICCAGAYAVFTMYPKNDLATQFGLATGISGQFMFGVAVGQLVHAGTLRYSLFFIVEAALTVLIPNFTHRIFSTVAAVGALSFGLAEAGLPGLAVPVTAAGCALVWRNEVRLAGKGGVWQAVGYGLALGVLQTATTTLLQGDLLFLWHGQRQAGWLQQHSAQLGTLLVSAVFLATAVDILRRQGIASSSREGIATLACAAVVMAASFPAHGLAPSLLVLILGFAAGNRVLLGLGFLALASFLSHYYFQMKETLLFKSLILAQTGLALLAVRWALGKLLPAREGKDA